MSTSSLDTHGRPLKEEEEPEKPEPDAQIVENVLCELDRDFVALDPVKARIREIAAALVIAKFRVDEGLATEPPTLHMCFTGSPGTGKTTVALRMGEILHRLGYLRKGHLVAVNRDDLVGQYVGHTAPKTRDVVKRAKGGVLFIDEAYYLHRPENERDYGAEAIEVLLTAMEDDRGELAVILAGYKDRMEAFFRYNPGMASRIAHHIDFPDYSLDELEEIAQRMVQRSNYRLGDGADDALRKAIHKMMQEDAFAQGRAIRNAIERARLRQGERLFDRLNGGRPSRDELETLEAVDVEEE